VPVDGAGVRSGTAFANRGSAVRIVLGRAVTERQLADDWIVVHELVHLAFPSVATEHHWIEEGLATYVESIARAQAGHLSAEQVWAEFVGFMPKGLPGANDQGLDHTPTWGRTYWGGAMFCLLADVQIRERTNNRLGLQDGLRAIVAAGGNMEADWPLERALRVADTAIESPALETLYDQMKATPVAVDLPQLWRRLGVEPRAMGCCWMTPRRLRRCAARSRLRRATVAETVAFRHPGLPSAAALTPTPLPEGEGLISS